MIRVQAVEKNFIYWFYLDILETRFRVLFLAKFSSHPFSIEDAASGGTSSSRLERAYVERSLGLSGVRYEFLKYLFSKRFRFLEKLVIITELYIIFLKEDNVSQVLRKFNYVNNCENEMWR